MPNRGDVVKKIGRELEDKIDLLRWKLKNQDFPVLYNYKRLVNWNHSK